MGMEHWWEDVNRRNRSAQREKKKNYLKANLSIINSEGTDLGSNLIFRSNRH